MWGHTAFTLILQETVDILCKGVVLTQYVNNPGCHHFYYMTVRRQDSTCHQHQSPPNILPHAIFSYYLRLQTGVSVCLCVYADVLTQPSHALSRSVFVFLTSGPVCMCVCAVVGQWQLKKRTVFVEEQHGCREEWRSWGRPNGSTPSCTEIKTHNKRVCSPSGPVHVALMEAKAAQSVNDQEPWRSP